MSETDQELVSEGKAQSGPDEVNQDLAASVTKPMASKPKSSGAKLTRTVGTFTCHTNSGNLMFFGRSADRKNKVEPIIGLVQFSTRVNVIFEAAKRDDPYADAHLLKIEAALRTADAFIHEQITVIDALLMDDGDISIKPSVAMNPQAHNVEFKTRFAHYALRLVSAYDRLVRGALAAQHTDRLSEGEWKRTVGVAATKLRHALACSGGFRASGATRNDFAANNQRAQAAVEKYGELAADVLRGSTRAERAPKIRHQSIVTAAQ